MAYRIKGTNTPYTGRVIMRGNIAYTTTSGTYEGNSKPLEVIPNNVAQSAARGGRVNRRRFEHGGMHSVASGYNLNYATTPCPPGQRLCPNGSCSPVGRDCPVASTPRSSRPTFTQTYKHGGNTRRKLQEGGHTHTLNRNFATYDGNDPYSGYYDMTHKHYIDWDGNQDPNSILPSPYNQTGTSGRHHHNNGTSPLIASESDFDLPGVPTRMRRGGRAKKMQMGGNTCPQGQYMSGGMCVSNSNGGGYRRGGKIRRMAKGGRTNTRRRMARGGRTIRRTTRARRK